MSGRMRCYRAVVLIFTVSVFNVVWSIPEQGVYTFNINAKEKLCEKENGEEMGDYEIFIMRKTMFVGSFFRVKVGAGGDAASNQDLSVRILVESLKCDNDDYEPHEECEHSHVQDLQVSGSPGDLLMYMISEVKTVSVGKSPVYLSCTGCKWMDKEGKPLNITAKDIERNSTEGLLKDNATVIVPKDGIYKLKLSVKVDEKTDGQVTIESRAYYGYLSAADWPLLPFFRIMFTLYLFYSLAWLVLCCCHRHDLLRIQYWIAGVIFIGLIEKAIFLGEYETLNKTGQSVYGAVVFGELVSSAKKMLSRILVIIVSVGFGIVKPRLGATLHKVLALGFIYFIASSIEGCLRATKEKIEKDNMILIAEIVLAVIDSCMCLWIFTALVQTMRTLRLRRNVVKLSLYRHFTNTLIFAVLASVGFMMWSFIEHKFTACIEDWKELWVDEAFWHLLFAIILVVIMVLWRPSANNQRYAYSPVTDIADDEAEEPMMNEAYDGIKMRSKGSQENFSRKADTQIEDDLKWIDENIPPSVLEHAAIMESDDEVVNPVVLMNKMQ